MTTTAAPANPLVSPLLTDHYQITMAYALWSTKRHMTPASYELFFRKNPFGGEFTIFAGLSEVLKFLSHFRFDTQQLEAIKKALPSYEKGFFEWLAELDATALTVHAMPEGSVVFPREPLLRVEGPLALAQLCETTILCLINYPSLVATNAMRHRLAVGYDKQILEFGMRRAQGPDGAVSASRYAYMGGSDGTSNVLAHTLFDIPVFGTHAHSYIMSFASEAEGIVCLVRDKSERHVDLHAMALAYRSAWGFTQTNLGELAAFASYASTFPQGFYALVDTYDSLNSGVPNFLCVAAALRDAGYIARGIRLDSGDLAYLARQSRQLFEQAGERMKDVAYVQQFRIIASNELDETTLVSLTTHGHDIDMFAIGTHLVTCQKQSALGCVYKMVAHAEIPRIKISQELSKMTIPGRKMIYRLHGREGKPLLDVLVSCDTPPSEHPQVGKPIMCLHPFEEQKRVVVTPSQVTCMHELVWHAGGASELPTLEATRAHCRAQVAGMREDHMRFVNPTPYKVAVDQRLHRVAHDIWLEQTPIRELS